MMVEKKKILILDDNEEVLNTLSDVLLYMNFEVKATQDIYLFFKNLDEYKPDLVLIDYLLQGINGGEVCHQVKSSSGTLPVIMMSAFPKVFQSLGNYGCDDFLPKPFDMDDLVKKINKCINNSMPS